MVFFFFFSSRRRHTRSDRDWSSDVCSSDLEVKHQKEGIYVLQDFKIAPERVPELEAALKITEEVLRHLIVRKQPEKPSPTAVAPPPAEVVLEPVAVESRGAADASDGDREER